MTDKLPEDLPVEVIEHELPKMSVLSVLVASCIRWQKPEELKTIPARMVILQHVRYIYSCGIARRIPTAHP